MLNEEKRAYLGIGTNLGDKFFNIQHAINELKALNITPIQSSKIFESPPWGFESVDSFYNIVLEVSTRLTPFQLLVELKGVELKMGRKPKIGPEYTSRIIDIDIIDYNAEVVIYSDLNIPHLSLVERNFVALPLLAINPNFILPTTQEKLSLNLRFSKGSEGKFINKLPLIN